MTTLEVVHLTKLFSDICKIDDNRLIKTVLLGMVEGNRSCRFCGIVARQWSNHIIDWCECSLPEAVQLVNVRPKWRTMISLASTLT